MCLYCFEVLESALHNEKIPSIPPWIPDDKRYYLAHIYIYVRIQHNHLLFHELQLTHFSFLVSYLSHGDQDNMKTLKKIA